MPDSHFLAVLSAGLALALIVAAFAFAGFAAEHEIYGNHKLAQSTGFMRDACMVACLVLAAAAWNCW